MRLKFAAVGAFAFATACANSPDLTSATQTDSANEHAAVVPSSTVRAQLLARDIAIALKDATLRQSLLEQWRDSRLSSDHKLVLADLLKNINSGGALEKVAAAGGRNTNQLSGIVAGLPSMDFYVPFLRHRREWTGTDDVLVGATFDFNAESLELYDTDGNAHTVKLANAEAGRPIILLHPAEPHATLVSTQVIGHGQLIDAGMDPVGARASARAEGSSAPCGTNCGPASVYPPGVYLMTLFSHEDDGWAGDLEMEIRSYVFGGTGGVPYYSSGNWYNPPGTSQCGKGSGIANFQPRQWYYNINLMVSPNITDVSFPGGCPGFLWQGSYFVNAVESDGPTNDDDFGRRFFFAYGAPGTFPWNATIGTGMNYYEGNGAPPPSGPSQIYLALEYK